MQIKKYGLSLQAAMHDFYTWLLLILSILIKSTNQAKYGWMGMLLNANQSVSSTCCGVLQGSQGSAQQAGAIPVLKPGQSPLQWSQARPQVLCEVKESFSASFDKPLCWLCCTALLQTLQTACRACKHSCSTACTMQDELRSRYAT